jgi:hypothetical protein
MESRDVLKKGDWVKADIIGLGFYEGYDLEGDWCRITHFSIVNTPM